MIDDSSRNIVSVSVAYEINHSRQHSLGKF